MSSCVPTTKNNDAGMDIPSMEHEVVGSKINRIAFIEYYLPHHYAIAAFTTDLCGAGASAYSETTAKREKKNGKMNQGMIIQAHM